MFIAVATIILADTPVVIFEQSANEKSCAHSFVFRRLKTHP